MGGEATTADVLARLEALAAEIDGLKAQNAAQAAEIARFGSAPPGTNAPTSAGGTARKPGRRGALRTLLTASAAGALLAIARGATTDEVAHANQVYGSTSDGNAAVFGTNTATTAVGIGVFGASTSTVNESVGVWGSVFTQFSSTSTGQTYGVLGDTSSTTSNASGVKGIAKAASGATNGVWGTNASTSGSSAAVYATSTANSGATKGVWGRSSSTDAGAYGVYGEMTASNAPGTGVRGVSAAGYGVRGTSTSGIGVYGESTSNYGCGGATSQPGFAGLFGYAGVASAAGFLGVNGAPGGTAGYFHGAVTVDGPFQVVNGAKNALVAHPDGSHRRMYCQEAPEPWFEDFGTAQLQNGKATVRLDPDFAAVVKADAYEVFPVPKGECKGLYVANQTPASFEVRELQGGTSSVPFSYRLVARRKDDVGKRLEKVDLPRFDLRPPGPPATPPGQDKESKR